MSYAIKLDGTGFRAVNSPSDIDSTSEVYSDTLPAPTAAQQLASAQTAQIAILSKACQTQIYAGFTSSALGAAYHYPAQDKDQANLNASVTNSLYPNLPAGWTTDFWCADSAGVWALRPHTAAQIQQAGSDGKTVIMAAIKQNDTLAAQVNSASTVAAVQAIIWVNL